MSKLRFDKPKSKGLTEYGKMVREFRCNKKVILFDQARALGYSTVFTSDTETGKVIPGNVFIYRVCKFLGLSTEDAHKLSTCKRDHKSTAQKSGIEG